MARQGASRRDFGSNDPAGKGKRRLRWVADMRDGRGRVRHSRTIRGTKRDGDRMLAALQLKYSDNRGIFDVTLPAAMIPPSITVGDAWERWVLPDMLKMEEAYRADPSPAERGKRDKMKTSTLRQHQSTWRVHVGPRWADVPVSEIRYSDIQRWLDDGMTEKPAMKGLVMLRLIMRYCVRNEVIPSNAAEDSFRMPTTAKRHDDHGVWSLEELNEALWPQMHGEACEAAFILSAFDGARTGECLAPRLDEIERLESGGLVFAVVPFLRQVMPSGRVSEDSDLKNRWSPRITVLPPPWSCECCSWPMRAENAARYGSLTEGTADPSRPKPCARSSSGRSGAARCPGGSSGRCAGHGALGSPPRAYRTKS